MNNHFNHPVVLAALAVLSLLASAPSQAGTPKSVDYTYAQHLDIAKVIKITTDDSATCAPVKSHMLYVDSQGIRHDLEYLRLSDACATD